MSLAEFAQAAWPIIEPATVLVWSWHLDAVCAHVQAQLDGNLGKQNLLVLVPPGSAKSTIVSVCAPAWKWIRSPWWRATFASGNPAVVTRDSLRCRAILDSAWYRRTFGIDWSFAGDQNQKLLYENSARGFRAAITTGARVTGSRPHAIFVDDALDAADAYSKASREAVRVWWTQAYANRLADPTSGTRCVIQQRLHPEDLAGVILSTEGDAWETLCIPQIWEKSQRTVTSLGWTDPRNEDGELMFPGRFPQSVVDEEKARLGISGFAGQHQQRPTAADGEVFKRGYLQLLAPDKLPICTSCVVSIDSAFKTGQENDYSVKIILGTFERGIFIQSLVRAKVPYPQLKAATVQLAAWARPEAVLVEDKASGQSLVQDLQQDTTLPIVAVPVVGDKLARAWAIAPTWESGRIFAPADAPWLEPFLEELYAFPKAPHDDQVDAFVQGVRYLIGGAGSGLLAYYSQQLATQQEEAKTEPRGGWLRLRESTGERARREGAVITDSISPWHVN